MARGLPKSYIKKYGVSKKAWRMYRASKGKRKTKTVKRSKPRKYVRRRTYMARKRRRRRSFFSTQTVFKWLRVGALVAPMAIRLTEKGPIKGKISGILFDYTGYATWDKRWHGWEPMMRGWMPFIATVLITKGISKLSGIIRRL